MKHVPDAYYYESAAEALQIFLDRLTEEDLYDLNTPRGEVTFRQLAKLTRLTSEDYRNLSSPILKALVDLGDLPHGVFTCYDPMSLEDVIKEVPVIQVVDLIHSLEHEAKAYKS